MQISVEQERERERVIPAHKKVQLVQEFSEFNCERQKEKDTRNE